MGFTFGNGLVQRRVLDVDGHPIRVQSKLPPATEQTPSTFKGLDHWEPATGDATSTKTLDTSTPAVNNNPSQIYYRLKGYIDKPLTPASLVDSLTAFPLSLTAVPACPWANTATYRLRSTCTIELRHQGFRCDQTPCALEQLGLRAQHDRPAWRHESEPRA
jgi:hypothetical protein